MAIGFVKTVNPVICQPICNVGGQDLIIWPYIIKF